MSDSAMLGPRIRAAIGWTIAALIFGLMIKWGGIPKAGLLFWIGVVLYSVLTLVLGMTIWRLYRNPAQKTQQSGSLSTGNQQLLAASMVIFSLYIMISLFWDELWHRRYDFVPTLALDDSLWPPHIMLYICILFITLTAGYGLYRVWRKGGTVRERFQSEPALGIIGLIAFFFLLSIPADQIWHVVYGLDLTVWSLPHLMLIWGIQAIILGGIAIQQGLMRAGPWQLIRLNSINTWIILIMLACAQSVLIQLMAGEWDGGRDPNNMSTTGGALFWARPEWLYPVLIGFIGALSSFLTLYTLRRIGAATLVALITLLLRLGLIGLLGNAAGMARMTMETYIIASIPALALDLCYWFMLRRQLPFAWKKSVVVVGPVYLAAALPIISATKLYPRINSSTLGPMLLFGMAGIVAGAWCGVRLGQWVYGFRRDAQIALPGRRAILLSVSTIGLAVALAVIIILLAPPPN